MLEAEIRESDRLSDEPAQPARAEYEAALSGVAYRLAPERLLVHVTGADRVAFLHGTCTQNIKALSPDAVAYGLILTERAHVLADAYVYGRNEELLLETERANWGPARAQLEKLIVADDVELNEDTVLGVMELEGPRAFEALTAVLGHSQINLDDWRCCEVDGVLIASFPRRGSRAGTVVGPVDRVRELANSLPQTLKDCVVARASLQTFETLRIENGLARVGWDTDSKTIALEARLERGISFNKGCYLGQETIERVSSHGRLKKRLYGLKFAKDEAPKRGATVYLEGKEVGRITSSAVSPRLGGIALAILHHSAWQPGLEVSVIDHAGHYKGLVSDLPFTASAAN